MSNVAKQVCPNCGTVEHVKEVVYGLPSGDDFEDSEMVLGGCLIFEGQPSFVCVKCGWDDSSEIFKETLLEE